MFTFLRRFAWFGSDPTPKDRALAALLRGDYAQAERELVDALAVAHQPNERAFLFNKRGIARVGMGRTDDAISDFQAALECVPAFAPAMTNIGNVLLESGDLQGAIKQYQAAVRADDFYSAAHLNLGIAYKRAGRLAEGVRELRRANSLEVRRVWGQRNAR